MKLLDFTMPYYARLQWATKELKDPGELKLTLARYAYHELERLSVYYGIRKCASIEVPDAMMPKLKKELTNHDAFFIPIEKKKDNNSNDIWIGVISLDLQACQDFVKACRANDHIKQGELLGYPSCCTEFFNQSMEAGYVDPIWQYAGNKEEHIKKKDEHFIRVAHTCSHLISPFLRYIDLRLIPHVPCSPSCEHSVKIAEDIYELGKEKKVMGIEDLVLLLSMPAEWDAAKGIAYISTPMFKIEASSVTCYPKHVVQKEGTYYPEGAPTGLKFPWNEYMRK